jgi:peptide/nickel transport system ATP-binding protein
MTETLATITGLRKTFSGRRAAPWRRGAPNSDVQAVRGLDLDIQRGEILGLIGESGSGKTTTGRLLLNLETATDGHVVLDGDDVATAKGKRLHALRRKMQIVFQDPYDSLNPGMRVVDTLLEPLQAHRRDLSTAQMRELAVEMLETIDLRPAADFVHRYPHELSGGQRQRVAIARALILQPELLVADEPTSMLDVSVRSGILNLLLRLKRELGLTMVFITHDLATASYMCDRIAVMYQGRLVEVGPTEQVIHRPAHPYTRALVAVVGDLPTFLADRDSYIRDGEVDASRNGVGCPFAGRCPEADFACLEVSPELANDTAATLEEARRLWRAVDRPNLMVKVPGTPAGLPAVEVHLSDIESREEWRHVSVVRDLCVATVSGEGADGYRRALEILHGELSK